MLFKLIFVGIIGLTYFLEAFVERGKRYQTAKEQKPLETTVKRKMFNIEKKKLEKHIKKPKKHLRKSKKKKNIVKNVPNQSKLNFKKTSKNLDEMYEKKLANFRMKHNVNTTSPESNLTGEVDSMMSEIDSIEKELELTEKMKYY